ncbi:ABC transporter substrate-binding protein [Roseomonas sp. OT10]|uniref:ABC transporter substrate-binding protein n=1 Tax=Roseomonas cutis TaxID=2897332 RepID=UPI001E4DB3DD|nr:ABC transporter substrate-binding protein [Roseomonas sp. OT10]UFN47276.1 ABC transporter substrate-binding protein [Roseomonas sp. OT10]
MPNLSRRQLAGALALGAAAPAFLSRRAHAQDRGTLRFVPHADLSILDPLGSTANIVKMHAYMVYDTLFALDEGFTPRPQMVQDHTLSDDRRTWRFRLREGLRWHDGTPVTAEDCVASLRRWGARDAAGQLMMRMTENLRAVDDRVFELKLTRPYGIVLESFSKVASNVPFMMPKRLAETDPFTAITDPTGSGPFRFVRGEWDPGSKVVYEKFDGYAPRAEAPSAFAGGKVVKLNRVEWVTIRDQQTAMGALQSGQVDLWEAPIMDLLPVLKAMRGVQTRVINKTGTQGQIYFNHTIPPFDNAKARQAMFWLTKQEDYLQAISGNPDYYRTCASFFACGTPMANEAGSEPLLHPNAEKAKALFREAGWDFAQPIVLLDPVDEGIAHPATLVTAQAMRAIGLNVDAQALDWATALRRRNSTTPVSQGGWNILHSYNSTIGMSTPVWSVAYSGACDKGLFGQPCDAKLEDLRLDWALAEGRDAQLAIAKAYQERAFETGHHVPLGQWTSYIAHRNAVTGILDSLDVSVFWNLEKTA